jgi:hypothetical protein
MKNLHVNADEDRGPALTLNPVLVHGNTDGKRLHEILPEYRLPLGISFPIIGPLLKAGPILWTFFLK